MASWEFDLQINAMKRSAESFLRDNWYHEVSLDNVLPLVLLQKAKGKRPAAYPVLATSMSEGFDSAVGSAVGSAPGDCFLFMVNFRTQDITMSFGQKDLRQWKFSGAKQVGSYICPGNQMGVIDYVKFGFLSKDNREDVSLYNFGSIKDKFTRLKRELTLISFSRIHAAGMPELSRIRTILWIEDKYKKKLVDLGAARTGGKIIRNST